MIWMIKWLANAFDVAFSPWFVSFICGCLAGFTGLIIAFALGVI